MSSTGRCYDNARMESFFATLTVTPVPVTQLNNLLNILIIYAISIEERW